LTAEKSSTPQDFRGYAVGSVRGPKGPAAEAAAVRKSGIVYNEHMESEGRLIFEHACRMGLEGIVSKATGYLSIRPREKLAQDQKSQEPGHAAQEHSRKKRSAAGKDRALLIDCRDYFRSSVSSKPNRNLSRNGGSRSGFHSRLRERERRMLITTLLIVAAMVWCTHQYLMSETDSGDNEGRA
jgi:hypothetical protein